MSKGNSDPPPQPDPYATSSAQGQANVGTAVANAYLNNPNQVTPYGTSTTTATGTQSVTQPDGSVTSFPTFTTTQALSAAGQHQLDQQNAIKSALGNDALSATRNLRDTFSNPLTADQFGTIQTSAGPTAQLTGSYDAGQYRTGYDPGGAITRSYDTGPALQYGYDAGGNIVGGYASGGPIQRDVNLNTNAPTTFGRTQNGVQYFNPGDFSAARNDATNAALARLAPTIAAQQESLQARLANQGVTAGSSAYNAANLAQAQQNNDLYLGAVQTGDAEQQALFGQQATSNQLYNAAQGQDYSQQLGRGQFAQQGIQQNNAAVLDMGNFHNAAQAQGEQESAARAAFSNSAQSQRNSQNAVAAGFFNSTVGQQNAQNAARAAFENSAQAQSNGQNAAAAGFFNAATGQQAQQNAERATFYNQSQQQDYQNRLSGAQFNNQAVNQQEQQAFALQNQQINEVSALMGGGQVAAPSFTPYQGSTIDQTPLSSDVYASAGLAENAYQAQLQAQAQNQAAFGSALGGLFGGIGRKSDVRLKSDIAPVARARNGLMIYRYRMPCEAPGWHLGFLAHEVALLHPEAVYTDPDDGFARVLYELAVA